MACCQWIVWVFQLVKRYVCFAPSRCLPCVQQMTQQQVVSCQQLLNGLYALAGATPGTQLSSCQIGCQFLNINVHPGSQALCTPEPLIVECASVRCALSQYRFRSPSKNRWRRRLLLDCKLSIACRTFGFFHWASECLLCCL